jgi:hypothetical protein
MATSATHNQAGHIFAVLENAYKELCTPLHLRARMWWPRHSPKYKYPLEISEFSMPAAEHQGINGINQKQT